MEKTAISLLIEHSYSLLAQSEDTRTWDPEGVTMVLFPCPNHFPL